MRLTQAAAVTRVKTQGAPERQLRGLHGIRRGSEVRVFDGECSFHFVNPFHPLEEEVWVKHGCTNKNLL